LRLEAHFGEIEWVLEHFSDHACNLCFGFANQSKY
jgi:hypothetical protein